MEPFAKFEVVNDEEQFCEIILNFDQWFRRKCNLTYFLSRDLVAPLFCEVEPYVQVLVEGIMRKNSVKLF